MKLALVLIFCAVVACGAPNPIHWSLAGLPHRPIAAGASFSATLSAVIDPNWHLYAMKQEEGGPVPLEIALSASSDLFTLGAVGGSKPIRLLDSNFGKRVSLYLATAQFHLPISISAAAPRGPVHITIQVRYQSCNDLMCLPPRLTEVDLPLQIR